MSKSKPVSLHEFKSWLSQQKDLSDFFNLGMDAIKENDGAELIGRPAKSKVSAKKLIEKIESEDSDVLVNEFIKNGGTIADVSDKNYLIEVDSGSFEVPKFYVKVKRAD